MRKTLFILVIIALILTLVPTQVFAGTVIDGASEVYAGSIYVYMININYSGADIIGVIKGLGKTEAFDISASGMGNESLSYTNRLLVEIPTDASVGDKFEISVSGQYSYYDESNNLCEQHFADSITITVVGKSNENPAEHIDDSDQLTESTNPTPEPTPTPKVSIEKQQDNIESNNIKEPVKDYNDIISNQNINEQIVKDDNDINLNSEPENQSNENNVNIISTPDQHKIDNSNKSFIDIVLLIFKFIYQFRLW